MGRLQDFKESFLEVLLITEVCLTSFYFWLPVLLWAYLFFQLWMMFAIHPLTILILPAILAIYTIILEEKRFKAQHKLANTKCIMALHPIGAHPEPPSFKWDVEATLKEYVKLLKKNKKSKDKR